MPNIEYAEPAALNQYYHYLIDDINIYIWKLVSTNGELEFVLKNFLMLKYVDVVGIKLM
jgi:hypothetical protein